MRPPIELSVLAATAMLLVFIGGLGSYYRRVIAQYRVGSVATNDLDRRQEVINWLFIGVLLSLALAVTLALSWEYLAIDRWPHLSFTYLLGLIPSPGQLRPALPDRGLGEGLGYLGSALMGIALLYNKGWVNQLMSSHISRKLWLDFHIFCGVLGPVLITFHSAFRLGGLVAISYWAMALVFLSGLVGRYIYVQIPRGLAGQVLAREEVERHIATLTLALAGAIDGRAIAALLKLQEVELAEAGWWRTVTALVAADLRGWWHERVLALELSHRLDRDHRRTLLAAYHERRLLLRRSRNLAQMRRLLAGWSRLHHPMTTVMVLFAVLHVAVALLFHVEN